MKRKLSDYFSLNQTYFAVKSMAGFHTEMAPVHMAAQGIRQWRKKNCGRNINPHAWRKLSMGQGTPSLPETGLLPLKLVLVTVRDGPLARGTLGLIQSGRPCAPDQAQ